MDEPSVSRPRLQRRARSLAGHLSAMLQLTINQGRGVQPDIRGRTANALDAAAELACIHWTSDAEGMRTPGTPEETPDETVCERPDLFSTPRESLERDLRGARLLMRGSRVVHALLDEDPTDAAFESAEIVMDLVVFQLSGTVTCDERREFARAMRLIGGLLTYASTYRGAGTTDEIAAGHDERRRILESLSAEFTNRTERGGDVIASIGGSLRLNAGARFTNPDDDAGTAFWGPASLVVGLGLDVVPNPDVGFHLELGVFDLGQYLDFGDGVALRTPSPAAALSPSLTIAVSFLGPQVPVIVGATFGANPFPPDSSAADQGRRVLYLGGIIGFYVPLFDLN